MFHVIVSICTFSFDEYHDIYVQLPTRTITIIRLVTLISIGSKLAQISRYQVGMDRIYDED